MKLNYTDEQNDAISFPGNMVITACPGSGKTTVVVEKIRLCLPFFEEYQGVIAITFTVKASEELKKRCKKNAFNTKQSFFGTIDSFCLKEIIYPFISRVWGRSNAEVNVVYNDELDDDDRVAYADITAGVLTTVDITQDVIQRLIILYRKGIILMSTVGLIANHIMENSSSCKKYLSVKYKGVFVDEYQDSSEPQHMLFMRLVKLGMTGVAVGDVDQSIYKFRGGNPEHIGELKKQNSGFKNFDMSLNHRCHPSISNYARRLFDEKCLLAPVPDDEIMMRRYHLEGNQTDVAKKISKWIPEAKKKYDIKNNIDIAILVRNNATLNYVSQGMNVPFRIYEDNPLTNFSDVHSKLFIGLLHYKYNLLITSQDILSDYISFVFSDKKCRGFRKVIKKIRDIPDNELFDYMKKVSCHIYGENASEKVLAGLEKIISTPTIRKQFETKDDNEVQIMTLHKAKGLEFDLVFHLDLYEWIFPRRQFTGNFDDPPLYPDWDQDLDLHYVGITRARKMCVLISSKIRIKDASSKKAERSPFLNLPGLNGLYVEK